METVSMKRYKEVQEQLVFLYKIKLQAESLLEGYDFAKESLPNLLEEYNQKYN